MPAKNNPTQLCSGCKRRYVLRNDGKVPLHPTRDYAYAKSKVNVPLEKGGFGGDSTVLDDLESDNQRWCPGGGKRGNPLNPRGPRTPRDKSVDVFPEVQQPVLTVSHLLESISRATGQRVVLNPHTLEPEVLEPSNSVVTAGTVAPEPVDEVLYQHALETIENLKRENERLQRTVEQLTQVIQTLTLH